MQRKSISFEIEVAQKIEEQASREERSFSQVVNRTLREAFQLAQDAESATRKRRNRKEAA